LRYSRAAFTISGMFARLKLMIVPALAVAGSLALLSAAGVPTNAEAQLTGQPQASTSLSVSARSAQLPALVNASGKIHAKLSKKSLTAAEAGKVKLLYRFAPASKHFSYRLSKQSASSWAKLRTVARVGHFSGSYTKTLKSIFSSKPVVVGSYRLELAADANRIQLGFTIVTGNSSGSNPAKPKKTAKLIFIHHSTGEAWLADGHGGLGIALKNNNYFVSDTNYGWGPDAIGDKTDTGNWWTWFSGSQRDKYTKALYKEFGQHSSYTRLSSDPDPSRENEIIMFKSCFPNSAIDGKPNDPAKTGSNPLRGNSSPLTAANAKGIYNDILEYFAAHQDMLFVAIVTPPLASNATNASQAANARAMADWLVNDWLDGYKYKNVAVFDFYNVLTSNGGGANTNDLGAISGNHHRWWNGAVQHSKTGSSNFLAYPTGDSHPSAAGDKKATGEFVPLLNYYYHRWADSQ